MQRPKNQSVSERSPPTPPARKWGVWPLNVQRIILLGTNHQDAIFRYLMHDLFSEAYSALDFLEAGVMPNAVKAGVRFNLNEVCLTSLAGLFQ